MKTIKPVKQNKPIDRERLNIEILRRSIQAHTARLDHVRSEYEKNIVESSLAKEEEELKQLQSENPENFI